MSGISSLTPYNHLSGLSFDQLHIKHRISKELEFDLELKKASIQNVVATLIDFESEWIKKYDQTEIDDAAHPINQRDAISCAFDLEYARVTKRVIQQKAILKRINDLNNDTLAILAKYNAKLNASPSIRSPAFLVSAEIHSKAVDTFEAAEQVLHPTIYGEIWRAILLPINRQAEMQASPESKLRDLDSANITSITLFIKVADAAKHHLQTSQEVDCKENSLSSYSSGDVKEQAEMQLSRESVSLFHRVADNNVTNRIFTFLPLENLARITRVCKRWNLLASHNSLWNSSALCKQFRSLKILDEKTWETHVDLEKFGLETSDVPPLDKRALIPTLQRLMTLPVEGNAGITLLTIPKGLTLNKLRKIVQLPKQGNKISSIGGDPFINETFGDRECLKSYKVVITNSILNESRDKSDFDRQKLLNTMGGQKPTILSITTLCCLTFMCSAERNPTTLYRNVNSICFETLRGFNVPPTLKYWEESFKKRLDKQIIVGDFNRFGDNDKILWFKCKAPAPSDRIGTAAQWEISQNSQTDSKQAATQTTILSSSQSGSKKAAAQQSIISSSQPSRERVSNGYKI